MAEPGTIFTASTAKKYLWDNKGYVQPENPYYGVTNYGGNFWQDTYQNIAENERALVGAYDFNRQKAIAEYQGDFYDAALAAYKSSLGERVNVMKSGLGQGYKEKLYDDLDAQLNSAYDQYMSIYKSNRDSANQTALQGQMSAIESANKARTNLSDMMTTEATNMSGYLNAHFDYLGALWDKYEAGELGELGEELFNKGSLWEPYINYDVNTPIGFKDLDEIKRGLFENGELNESGLNFIKLIQSQRGYDFGDYLSEFNKDLYNWSIMANQYNSPYRDTLGVNSNRAAALASIGLYDTSLDDNGNEIYTVQNSWPLENNESAPPVKIPSHIENALQKDDILITPDNKEEFQIKLSNPDATVYYKTADFGTVKKYKYNNSTVTTFDDLYLSDTLGLGGDVRDKSGDNFTIRWDGDSGRTYRLQFAKENKEENAVVTNGSIINNIINAVGKIENEKLYHYFDGKNYTLYMGLVGKDGTVKLRKVVGRGNEKTYDLFMDNIRDDKSLNKKALEYTRSFTYAE